jgi:hypothetical protein
MNHIRRLIREPCIFQVEEVIVSNLMSVSQLADNLGRPP